MMKSLIYWIIALAITLAAAVYQRMTGPTYPAKAKIPVGARDYTVQLPRSHTNDKNCRIQIPVPDTSVHAVLQYKRYPTDDPYQTVSFRREGEVLAADLPAQPPAGKIEYLIRFTSSISSESVFTTGPVVIRFKGPVPAWILVPHIFFMFFSMWFSNLAGLLALTRRRSFRTAMLVTLILLFAGGLVLGPLVQKYAFGALWTGFPFGYDLTDNKTLIAFIFWLVALAGNRKKERRWLVIMASVIQIVVFSIPHSLLGSELHYETGKVVTGMIYLLY